MDGVRRQSDVEEAQRPQEVEQRGIEALSEHELVEDALLLCQGVDGTFVSLEELTKTAKGTIRW